MLEKQYVKVSVEVPVELLSTTSSMAEVRRTVETEDDLRLAAIAELNRRRIEAAKQVARDRFKAR